MQHMAVFLHGRCEGGGPMSTRKLIVLALLAGLAILVAFALQITLIAR
jgi:hypothetical protein